MQAASLLVIALWLSAGSVAGADGKKKAAVSLRHLKSDGSGGSGSDWLKLGAASGSAASRSTSPLPSPHQSPNQSPIRAPQQPQPVEARHRGRWQAQPHPDPNERVADIRNDPHLLSAVDRRVNLRQAWHNRATEWAATQAGASGQPRAPSSRTVLSRDTLDHFTDDQLHRYRSQYLNNLSRERNRKRTRREEKNAVRVQQQQQQQQ